MIPEIAHITDDERQRLIDAVAQITILIAGADGKIDPNETSWAEKLTEIRSYNGPAGLNAFYTEVGRSFSDTLQQLINALPKDTEDRTVALSENLEKLNVILAKLDLKFAAGLYDSYKSFAEHVAKASGGFLRFFSVSSEEHKLMALTMLTPLEYVEEESPEEIEDTDQG